MTITRLSASTLLSGGYGMSGVPISRDIATIPAAGVPVGATCIVFGFIESGDTATVRDTKGNVWTVRHNGNADILLADSQITTALVSGDKVFVDFSDTDAWYSTVTFWCSGCLYHSSALATWTGTAATGGTVTTPVVGALVLGGFGIASNAMNPTPTIATPGSGYTNETGVSGQNVDFGTAQGFDWESKIGAVAGPETATATVNVAGATRRGVTAAYFEPIPNQMAGVV